jgi:PTH2 family peptidyl-tRNA hydrolase
MNAGSDNYKQIIILRKDLNMRKGKMVAQGAHASMAAILNLGKKNDRGELVIPNDSRVQPWLEGKFKKICVSVSSEAELLSIYEEAIRNNLVCSLIQDSGLTEFGGIPTYTSVAIGPDKEENIDPLTKKLSLL